MKKCVCTILLSLVTSFVWAEQYITVADVKVRAGKDLHAGVLGKLKKNTTIEATGVGDAWCKVSYNGIDGYVQEKCLSTPGAELESYQEWDDTDTIFLIIGGVLLMIAIGFGYNYILSRRRKRSRYQRKDVHNHITAHWYQCRHCSVFIHNGTIPQIAGCVHAEEHHWINLGHVGTEMYMCKKCSTVVNVASEPVLDGCASGEDHHWRKF